MAEEVYFPRKKAAPEEIAQSTHGDNDPLSAVRQIQQAAATETGRSMPDLGRPDSPFEIGGNIPPQLRAAFSKRGMEENLPPTKPQATPDSQSRSSNSTQLDMLLQKLAGTHQWEPFEFPSKGKFYTDIPAMVHVRPMTGEEEQILATPRFVKRGKAIDMIFDHCIQERIPTEKLLAVDRTHLLIYLRGISYTPQYDVEIRCSECSAKFQTEIDLNTLEVDDCPESFGPDSLSGRLPTSGFTYRYRLPTGADEVDIAQYRDRRIQQFGDGNEDDTLLYRTALLMEEIEGVTALKEIQFLLKKLPISDVSYLRNEINEPPFGVRTEIPIMCPSCSEEFKIDLPLETNFFFPRKREDRAQA
jgi:hypothetical protein